MENETIANKNTFLLNRSELPGRLDPYFNYHLKNSQLTSVFEDEALYKLCKPFSGGTPSKSNPEYWDGDIPWVSPKDFKGLYLHDSEDHISEKGLANSSTKLVPANSILVVVRSGVLIHSLPVTINKVPVTINQDLKAFVIKDERILPEYLGMYFYVFGKQLLPLITKHSTTVQSINTDQFSKLRIPIPDKLTQQRIVDLINDSIEKKEDMDKKAARLLSEIDAYLGEELGGKIPEYKEQLSDRIFISTFKQVVGKRIDPNFRNRIDTLLDQKWNYTLSYLKDLIIKQPQYGANEEAKEGVPNEDTRYIRITDIDELGNLKTDIWKTAARVEDKYLLNYNDILFARSGSVGRCYIHKNIDYPAIFAGYLIRFVIDESKALPDYIFHYCNSAFYKYWVKSIERPAVQSNINSEEFKSMSIPLPELPRQREIVQKVNQVKTESFKLKQEAVLFLEDSKESVRNLIING